MKREMSENRVDNIRERHPRREQADGRVQGRHLLQGPHRPPADEMEFDDTIVGRKRDSKTACPYHAWDEHGRPDPPAGYCGPLCLMRPREGR